MRSRWIHHVTEGAITRGPEGFVHGSFLPDVEETVRLYLQGRRDLRVFCIDPRRAFAKVEDTPRGPMPHLYGEIDPDAVHAIVTLDDLRARPDFVRGTRFGFVAFPNMTLLDLVGVWDPISRIAKMGFDETTRCEIVATHEGAFFEESSARMECTRVRPPLDEFDVLVIPGGHGTRPLEHDEEVIAWLNTFPKNRLLATVCTGALLAGAMGRLRGKRATTHHLSLDQLERHGAEAVRERVVDEGDVITSGGVTSGLHLGLYLASEIAGKDAAEKIARQMEW